ncbi:chromosome-associated kinesin KIF4 [Nilaparvata lugens]|uniref:chromosome-associated kinesin KIF4 n=1 Tax=Nilaparvata lugens TaxID=108931 RepID=UPI00193D4C5C|nr:chromosome-associated kinesin KIF4 [Nilaparvata lugens]
MSANDTVQVAIRIRPLVESEKEKGSRVCLESHHKESQIVIKSSGVGFTFNYVFGPESRQEDIYTNAVEGLIDQLFKGYNVTILAYGQTGSGKTFTMGTNYVPFSGAEKGIIPQAVEDIFKKIDSDQEWSYLVTASFIELYQEQLYDLLSGKCREQSVVDIREDTRGICIPNLTETRVCSTDDTFVCLQQGSLCRATGATAMNSQSSRSHAIFTVTLNFSKKSNIDEAMTAKFHLVDLAGSERPKKTKATGQTFKEGVNINKGLLALGNVISALGGGSNYISYRDSKLTRLLQDSLGGNSQTLMIACVSPADYNQEETLSTLRYADRARKIKNRPIVNQDPVAAEMARLKKEVERLQLQLLENGGERAIMQSTCPPEHQQLLEENTFLNMKLKKMTETMSELVSHSTNQFERVLMEEKTREKLTSELDQLSSKFSQTVETLNQTKDLTNLEPLIDIQKKIEELQAEFKKSEDEMLTHQMDSDQSTSAETPPVNRHLNIDQNEKPTPGTPKEDTRSIESHVLEQAERSKQLQLLMKDLAYKEELAKKLLASSTSMNETSGGCEAHIKEMKDQISELQHEKDELVEQIKSLQHNNASSKIAEQRRKRLQELEQKINALNKKVVEQARVIKMKEKSDLKINNLNSEILAMKQAKVRLIQQMKQEGDRYRTYKAARERELCQLREQERRRQNQMIRMENLHNKQQNVLKRKVEEAAAVNKRLKDALAMKTAAKQRQLDNGKERSVSAWIDQELEVVISTAEAERTLKNLITDRESLSKTLSELKKNLLKADLDPMEKKVIEKEIENLTNDIDLRSTQIADMQQKIMDSNEENKSKSNFDQLHTMGEAKCAIKHLFTLAAEAKKESACKLSVFNELKEANDIAQKKLNLCNKQIEDLISMHQKQLHELETENEEKVYLLLRQLNEKDKNVSTCSSTDEQLLERMKIQNAELEKLDDLRQEVETLREKCSSLTAQLEASKSQKPRNKSFTISRRDVESSQVVYKGLPEDDEEEEESDDEGDDPDWRNTPIMKRLRALKSKVKTEIKGVPMKRGSDGVPRCGCSSDCQRRNCGCRKAGNLCSEHCKCDQNLCKNMSRSGNTSSNSDESMENKENSLEDNNSSIIDVKCNDSAVFKKPRVLSPLQ